MSDVQRLVKAVQKGLGREQTPPVTTEQAIAADKSRRRRSAKLLQVYNCNLAAYHKALNELAKLQDKVIESHTAAIKESI